MMRRALMGVLLFLPVAAWVVQLPGSAAGADARASGAPVQAAPQRPDARVEGARFRSRVDLVALDVCVRDRRGQLLRALGPEDFLILENSEPQELAYFLPDTGMPLSVMLLIDRSASMYGEKLRLAKAAARAFLARLQPEDEVGLVVFDGTARLTAGLTRDHDAIGALIDEITAKGQTAIYESVIVGLRELERAERGRSDPVRNALVILSDGEDTKGRPGYDYVLDEARRRGALVYSVSLRFDRKGRARPPARELTQLAAETGGRSIGVTTLASLTPIYEEIATELRHFYRLGYTPATRDADGEWRAIAVRVSHPDAVVRTRAGYYARVR